MWDADSGTRKRTLKGDADHVDHVAYSPDGRTLASGSWDKRIRLWDVVTGQLLQTLEGHADSVKSVAFSPNGNILASGSWDGTVSPLDGGANAEFVTLTLEVIAGKQAHLAYITGVDHFDTSAISALTHLQRADGFATRITLTNRGSNCKWIQSNSKSSAMH